MHAAPPLFVRFMLALFLCATMAAAAACSGMPLRSARRSSVSLARNVPAALTADDAGEPPWTWAVAAVASQHWTRSPSCWRAARLHLPVEASPTEAQTRAV